MACMNIHPDKTNRLLSTLKEPYESLLNAQEYRLVHHLERQLTKLRENVEPYRVSYIALTGCVRLASIPAVRTAIFHPEKDSLKSVSRFVGSYLRPAEERIVAYRWKANWQSKESKKTEAEKRLKPESAEWQLYYLGQKRCSTPFDKVIQHRRSLISKELLKIILPLSLTKMIVVFEKLHADSVPFDISMIAYHHHVFSQATDHVGRWLERHDQIKGGELMLNKCWQFYRETAAQYPVVSNGKGPPSNVLERYNQSPPIGSNPAFSSDVVSDYTEQLLTPLNFYDVETRTLGLGYCQISEAGVGHMLGFDSKAMYWPSLQRADVSGVARIQPTRSQTLGAFSIIASISADDEGAPMSSRAYGKRNGVAQYVNDSVGMGKTSQAFIVITGIFHLRATLPAAHSATQGSSTADPIPNTSNIHLPPILLQDRCFLRTKRMPKSPTCADVSKISSFPLPPSGRTLNETHQNTVLKATSYDLVIIVVPKSVINQWQTEWTKFIDGSRIEWIKIETVEELSAKKHLLIALAAESVCHPPTIIITTYPVVAHSWAGTQPKKAAQKPSTLFGITYTCLIADEAHRFRTVSTAKATAIHALSSHASVRLFRWLHALSLHASVRLSLRRLPSQIRSRTWSMYSV